VCCGRRGRRARASRALGAARCAADARLCASAGRRRLLRELLRRDLTAGAARAVASEAVRAQLRDERLQTLITEVDSAQDRERVRWPCWRVARTQRARGAERCMDWRARCAAGAAAGAAQPGL